jgi:hypothetical protein
MIKFVEEVLPVAYSKALRECKTTVSKVKKALVGIKIL